MKPEPDQGAETLLPGEKDLLQVLSMPFKPGKQGLLLNELRSVCDASAPCETGALLSSLK